MTLNNVFNQTWEIAKKNCVALIGFGFVNVLCSSLTSRTSNQDLIKIMKKVSEGDLKGAKAIQELANSTPFSATECIIMLIGFLLSVFIGLILFRFVKKAIDEDDNTSFTDLISSSAIGYCMYLLKYILYVIAIFIATLCCFIPGVYLLVRFAFVPYIAANEPELGISETFAKSMELTKGKFMQLFGYGIIAAIIALSGFLLCCIGNIFTGPLAVVFLGVVYNEVINENAEN